MEKEDRRIKKTKKALCAALSGLMQGKELHDISVKELCDRADIHRATFYYHYSDIFAFYDDMEKEFISKIRDIFTLDEQDRYDNVVMLLLNFLDENRELSLMFLGEHSGAGTRKRLSALVKERYREIWRHSIGGIEPGKDWELLAEYHLQGCTAAIASWLEVPFDLSKEDFAKLLYDVDTEFDSIVERYC